MKEIVVHKDLPSDMYALYLVLGDSESHRVLCFAERLLAVICSTGTEHYLCLQRNTFWETLHPHVSLLILSLHFYHPYFSSFCVWWCTVVIKSMICV